MEKVNIGIIGGSGLYQMPELQNVREQRIETPFGDPSDAFIIGELEGVTVAFLPRHARGHKFLPTEVPYRANIYAMKLMGVEYILSVSAVGSLQEKYAPTDMVIPDQGCQPRCQWILHARSVSAADERRTPPRTYRPVIHFVSNDFGVFAGLCKGGSR